MEEEIGVTQSANQHMHTFNFLFIKTYLAYAVDDSTA